MKRQNAIKFCLEQVSAELFKLRTAGFDEAGRRQGGLRQTVRSSAIYCEALVVVEDDQHNSIHLARNARRFGRNVRLVDSPI